MRKIKRMGAARRGLSLLLSALLLSGLCAPALAEAENTVYIDDAADLLDVLDRCSYDAWSRGKTVVLRRDISLGGVSVRPAGSFGGVFEGGGHTVSGFSVEDSASPAGLFAQVAPGGTVRNLSAEGSVTPGGTAEQVGGIAGLNRGTLENCSFTGTVSGDKSVGGIAGVNEGTLRLCTAGGGVTGKNGTGGIVGTNHGTVNACASRAYVNTGLRDPSLEVEELGLSRAGSLRELPSVYNVAVDSGGVAGFSDGELLGCRNSGSVGYPHIGYNVGGIVGRSCGHTASCVNEGSVFGRREVGGIAGVAEPYVKYSLRAGSLDAVREELNALGSAVDRAVADAERGGEYLSARLAALDDSLRSVEDRARTLSDTAYDGLTGNIDAVTDEVNRAGEILDNSVTQLDGVIGQLTEASGWLTEAVRTLDDTLRQLNRDDPLGELNAAAEDLKSAVWLIQDAAAVMRRGVTLIRQALDPADLEAMINEWTRQAEAAETSLKEWEAEVGERERELSELSEQLSGTPENADDLRERIEAVEAALAVWRQRVEDGTTLAQDLRRRADEAKAALAQDREQLRGAAAEAQQREKTLSEGMDSIEQGLDILENGRGGDGQGLARCLTRALSHLETASDDLRGASQSLEGVTEDTRTASDSLTAALRDAESLLDYLKAQEALRFEWTRSGADAAADAFFDALSDVSDQMGLLNHESGSSGDLVLEDVRAVNRRFNALMNTLLDAVDETENRSAEDLVRDTSDEDIDAVMDGKLLLCVNRGEVNGDIDVGGVAGAMMVFNAEDPEKDFRSLADAFRRSYELKCVLQGCVSEGTVTGRRDNVGGVCGSVSLGVVSACEGFGTVESESGGSVGGIAGFGGAVLRKCWARCSLAGEREVGGIAGSGDENLRVEGCRSLVEITRCGQYAGAVLGREAGVLKNNRFVSDSLGGVNGLSTAGTAEPVSYEELSAEEGAPAELQRFTLRFIDGDETVATKHFRYGESFGPEDFPALPEREGQYARWDRTDLAELHFDTTVTAEFYPEVTALESAITRSAGRPAFFAEGSFDGDDTLDAQPALYDFDTRQEGFLHLLRSYRRTMQEQWSLTLSRDGVHTLRYLPPEGLSGRLELYLRENEEQPWRLAETGKQGSYLTFEAPGPETELTVVSAATPWWVWSLLGLCLLTLGLLIADLVRWRAQKTAGAEDAAARAARRKKLRRRLAIQAAVLLALTAGLGAAVRLVPRVSEGMGLYRLLRGYTERTDTDMELKLRGRLGERDFDTAVKLSAADCEGRRVSCLTWQEIPVYFCDGTLLLENGRAYRAPGVLADYTQLLRSAASLYRALDVRRSESNDVRTYHATARGEDAAALLAALLPGIDAPETDSVELLLTVTDGELTSVSAVWASGADVLSAELRVTATGAEHSLPQAVRTALTSGDTAEDITEDAQRLILAWTEAAAREPLTARIRLSADCGPLLTDETLNWQRTWRYGQELSRVSRRGSTLYMSGDTVCTDSGTAVERVSFRGGSPLLRAFYEAFLLGTADCEALSGGWRYTISLDEAAMSRFAELIVPEADGLGALFSEGTVQLEVRGGSLSSLLVRCRGSVRVVREDVAATFTAHMSFDPDAAFDEPPAAVLDALGLGGA